MNKLQSIKKKYATPFGKIKKQESNEYLSIIDEEDSYIASSSSSLLNSIHSKNNQNEDPKISFIHKKITDEKVENSFEINKFTSDQFLGKKKSSKSKFLIESTELEEKFPNIVESSNFNFAKEIFHDEDEEEEDDSRLEIIYI